MGPSFVLEDLQRFIVTAIDAALARTQASGPRQQQALDGLSLDPQEREEDQMAWQQLAASHPSPLPTGVPQADFVTDAPQMDIALDQEIEDIQMADANLEHMGSVSSSGGQEWQVVPYQQPQVADEDQLPPQHLIHHPRYPPI